MKYKHLSQLIGMSFIDLSNNCQLSLDVPDELFSSSINRLTA